MAFQIKGKLIKVFDEVQVNDKFKKREFVIEKEENGFTDQIKFQLVQDKTSLIDNINLGQDLTVDFNIKGNQWKDSYFVNLQAWRIQAETGSNPNDAAPPPGLNEIPLQEADDDDLPF